MRNYTLLGPAALAAGFAVPRQAHPAADPFRPLLARQPILPPGQLPPVQKGGRREPGQRGSQQDEGAYMRAFSHETAQGVLNARVDRCPLLRL
jgi:hypothetical protein